MKDKNRALALKLIAAALLIIVCVIGATACKNNDGGNTPSATTTTAPQIDPITLVSGGEAKARVIYNPKGGNMVISAAQSLSSSLSELSGVVVVDSLDMLSEKNPEDVEILVGETEYSESKAALGALAPNSYSITISGKKIVVVSNNPYLYSEAVDALLGALSVSDGTMTLAGNFSKISESYPVVTLAADKKTDYTIIYANADATAKTQATALKNAFLTARITVQVSPDTSSASGKEILIGNTNRAASANSEAYYLNSYTRADDNGNLAITGNLEAGVADLIKYVEDISRMGNKIDIPTYLFGFVTPS